MKDILFFKADWPQQLTRTLAQSEQAAEPITVARLRASMDEPNPKGLTEHVQNLLILVFAEQGHYAFRLHGGEYDPNLRDFPDNLILIKQDLADPAIWKTALDNAGAVFGVNVNGLLTTDHLAFKWHLKWRRKVTAKPGAKSPPPGWRGASLEAPPESKK